MRAEQGDFGCDGAFDDAEQASGAAAADRDQRVLVALDLFEQLRHRRAADEFAGRGGVGGDVLASGEQSVLGRCSLQLLVEVVAGRGCWATDDDRSNVPDRKQGQPAIDVLQQRRLAGRLERLLGAVNADDDAGEYPPAGVEACRVRRGCHREPPCRTLSSAAVRAWVRRFAAVRAEELRRLGA
jgi:hypothetical protein